jgi:hypothetical protein
LRKFNLERREDETGISGTGIVTEGYEYDSGTCVMRWLTDTSSIAVYAGIEDVVVIHGHEGRTIVVWQEDDLSWTDLPLWAIDPVGYFESQRQV